MFHDFPEADVFGEPESSPFSEEDIDDEGEEDDPWEGEDELEECVPSEECVPDDRDNKRFSSEDERHLGSFLDLRRDEFLREGDHDEEGKDGDGGEPGAMLYTTYDEDAEYGERDDGERDGDTREIEEAKSSEKPSREHADDDDRDENSDAVFHAIRIESEERESDNRWCVNAESLDPDDLTKNGDEGCDDREEEKKCYGLQRHAGFDEKCDERMDRHTVMKYLITNI